jgi:hypothetical protein
MALFSTAEAAAAGPLIFALGAVGRVGAFTLSALLTPIGLVAHGLVGLGVAMAGFATASIARLSAMLIGLRMLSTFGAGATLSAMGASLLGLGRTMLKRRDVDGQPPWAYRRVWIEVASGDWRSVVRRRRASTR